MRIPDRGWLAAGGIGLLTGLLWFLFEMSVRLVRSHFWAGARPPDDYPFLLVGYSLVGLAGGIALFFAARVARKVSRATRAVSLAVLLGALFVRGMAGLEIPPRLVLRHLGSALAVCAAIALLSWSLVRLRRRVGANRLLVGGAILATMLVSAHLVLLRATDLESAFDRMAPVAPASDQPNVLLVSIDTLRADRLGSYGNAGGISPRMDRLGAEGALFERAIAHSPWTQPSFASLLTSTYPSQHGSFVLLSGEDVLYQSFLPEGEVTLAELLREHGYLTLAVQSICAEEELQRFDQGFQLYLCGARFVSSFWRESLLGLGLERSLRLLGVREGSRSGPGSPEADRVYETFRRLSARTLPEPFFAWLSFRDPHSPYLRRQEGVSPETALVVEALDPEDASTLTSELSEAYDDEVRFVDHYVGRTLDLLRERGILDETIVVLTSDHGEELGDHSAIVRSTRATMRGRFHGHSLYSELLRVPLLIRFPPKVPSGTRVSGLVRHVDLLPTILDLAGLDPGAAGDRFEGSSLLPLVTRDEPSEEPRLAFSERNLFGPQMRAIQDGRYKLILEVESGRVELYDLAVDPEETNDLAAVRKPEADRLLALLDRWATRMGPTIPPSPDPTSSDSAAREGLRALGYLR